MKNNAKYLLLMALANGLALRLAIAGPYLSKRGVTMRPKKAPALIWNLYLAFENNFSNFKSFSFVFIGVLFLCGPVWAEELQNKQYDVNKAFADNLAWGKAKDPENEVIRAKLSIFKKAYLDADHRALNALVGKDFKQMELIGSQIISNLNSRDAFDLEAKQIRFHKIEYNLVGFTTEGPKGRKNAVLISSYHAKHFTRRFYEIFSFSYDKKKGVGKLLSQVRMRLSPNIKMEKSGIFILLEEIDYNNLVRDLDKYGAFNRDIIFGKMFAQAAERIRGSFDKDDRYVAVFIPNFFVMPGSVITIEHHYTWPERKRRKAWNSFGKDFAVKKVQPFIFFPTTAWGSFDGQVKFSAFVDGNLIHDETFEIVAPGN